MNKLNVRPRDGVTKGAVTGSTELNCPHCGELLTAGVNDPMGEEQVRFVPQS
jgi:hypothetical protein